MSVAKPHPPFRFVDFEPAPLPRRRKLPSPYAEALESFLESGQPSAVLARGRRPRDYQSTFGRAIKREGLLSKVVCVQRDGRAYLVRLPMKGDR